MEPAYYRGDILFASNWMDSKPETGDVIIYQIENETIPIVHRTMIV